MDIAVTMRKKGRRYQYRCREYLGRVKTEVKSVMMTWSPVTCRPCKDGRKDEARRGTGRMGRE
jgi:hypothetical protein